VVRFERECVDDGHSALLLHDVARSLRTIHGQPVKREAGSASTPYACLSGMRASLHVCCGPRLSALDVEALLGKPEFVSRGPSGASLREKAVVMRAVEAELQRALTWTELGADFGRV
jgi:hypothetical protein